MRTLVRWAVMLYPAAWRARYGGELEALMEDAGVRGGDVWDLARGAVFMQITTMNFGKIVAGSTVAGVLAAGIWAVAQPRQYVSTAVMRMSSPAAGVWTDKMAPMQRLQRLQQDVLSRGSLTKIIQAQNLFQKERQQLPLEDIIQQMRDRNIQIRVMDGRGGATFTVNYSAGNPAEAQAATRAIVTAMIERNVAQASAAGDGPANIEVIDGASLPSEAAGQGRAWVVGRGGLAGMALGLVFGALWWVTRRQRWVSLWQLAGFAAAGMALGVGVAFLIPNEFISTAVLRTADAREMQSAVTRVLSDDSVAAMIHRQRLFTKEVSSDGIEAVTRKVRNQRIRVQVAAVNGGMTAYVVSFQYPDRFTAQRVTKDLVGQFVGQAKTEVLDPASEPQTPSWPNRLTIPLMGVIAGALLGLAAGYLRREKLVTA
ncbi:MAG: hypothetical protein ABI806_00710 [Candidatus Solibacter sp.]